jgi:hypothetical protein
MVAIDCVVILIITREEKERYLKDAVVFLSVA